MNAFDVARQAKGWLHDDEGPMLYDRARRSAGPFLEIGTYTGKSACWIGQAAKETGTVLFAVDHHRGSPEMAPGEPCYDESVLIEGRHDTIIELRRNLAAADLEQTVVPVVGDSETVGRWWQIPVGFCFIDGCHDKGLALRDYEAFAPWIMPDGYLLFHDTKTPGPAEAIPEALADGWLEVGYVGCTTILRRDTE